MDDLHKLQPGICNRLQKDGGRFEAVFVKRIVTMANDYVEVMSESY